MILYYLFFLYFIVFRLFRIEEKSKVVCCFWYNYSEFINIMFMNVYKVIELIKEIIILDFKYVIFLFVLTRINIYFWFSLYK